MLRTLSLGMGHTHIHKLKRIVCIDAFVDPVNRFAILLHFFCLGVQRLFCSIAILYAQKYCNRFQLEMWIFERPKKMHCARNNEKL